MLYFSPYIPMRFDYLPKYRQREITTFYRIVGENIRHIRKAKKKTQEDIAKQLYISRAYLVVIEAGTARPPVHLICAIASILHVDLMRILPSLLTVESGKNQDQ